MHRKVVSVSVFLVIGIILVACSPSKAERNARVTAIAVSIFATQTAQAPAPTSTPAIPPATTPAVPPTSLPAVAPDCPTPTAGTLLLKDEDGGYCLLYPEGYGVVGPDAGEVCLVPGEPPFMMCHSARLFIDLEGADGRTADQVAGALIVEASHSIERTSLIIADEEAVMLEPFYGQATSRIVLIVHTDQLYTLTFIGPWGEDGNPELEEAEQFYAHIIGSFVFLR